MPRRGRAQRKWQQTLEKQQGLKFKNWRQHKVGTLLLHCARSVSSTVLAPSPPLCVLSHSPTPLSLPDVTDSVELWFMHLHQRRERHLLYGMRFVVPGNGVVAVLDMHLHERWGRAR
jgi:hypothetical protein